MHNRDEEIKRLEYMIISLYGGKGPIYQKAMSCLEALKKGDKGRAQKIIQDLEIKKSIIADEIRKNEPKPKKFKK